ncbi:MAG TPA: hypothetical protein VFH38_07605 [Jatrophihabitans sp.]|nr:hypothetical protein [Jatrophihabitans sp.]
MSTATRQSASAAPLAVPRGFRATSVAWSSARDGWLLGAAPCRGRVCSYVLATTDGGTAWRRLGRVPARIAEIGNPDRPGITEIHFATPRIGFGFAPYLVHTTDGGRTWSRMAIPGGGGQVFDLVTNRTTAFAVVSPCKWADFGGCTGRLHLWRTSRLGGTRWVRVPLALPYGTRADLSVSGQTVYVVDPQRDVTGRRDKFYASTDGGRHFTARGVPCDATSDVPLVQSVATSATDVALLCVGRPGKSMADKFVYTSTDAARTYHYAGTMGSYGYQSQLAVSRTGNLAVASVSDGSFIYINDTPGAARWTMVWASSDGGAGWNDIQYTTGREAWVVRGPVSWFDGRGKLYATSDGGRHWYLQPIRG